MKESLIDIYFEAFNSQGHKTANYMLGINISTFCVLSGIYEAKENIKNLEQSEWGGLLYTDKL